MSFIDDDEFLKAIWPCKLAEALPLLEREANRSRQKHPWTRLGLCRLRVGQAEAACRALDRAVARKETSWALFLRSLSHIARKDEAAARRDFLEFRRTGPRAPALAVEAMLLASQGRRNRALAPLTRAARLSPGRPWPHDWICFLRLSHGELAEARKAMLCAASLDPQPWRFQVLSEICEQLGFLLEALRHARRACRMAPSAKRHALIASIHERRRHYPQSLRHYTKAAALEPSDPNILFSRSQTLAFLGRFGTALKDMDAALALGQNESAALWRAQLAALCGDRTAFEAALAGGLEPELESFARGYRELARLRPRKAGLWFARSAAAASSPEFKRKARFYLTASRMLEVPSVRPGPHLSLIGLGVNPPYSTSVEALREIARCQVLFNNVPGAEVAEMLWPLCRDARPIFTEEERSAPMTEEAEHLKRMADKVLRQLRAGKRVGMVTRGSALVRGELGTLILRCCHAEGFPCLVLPALSSSDAFMARFGGTGWEAGAGLMDSTAASSVAKLDADVPWTIFVGDEITKSRFAALGRTLARRWGPNRPALVFDHKLDQEPIVLPISRLDSAKDSLSQATILFLPGPSDYSRGREKAKAQGEPGLLLAGLGPQPDRHASIETLEALGRRAVVIAEGLDAQAARFIARFVSKGALSPGNHPGAWTRFSRALGAGRSVAYVTPHHPFRFSPRARAIVETCSSQGLPWLALGSISAEILAIAGAELPLGTGLGGIQAFEGNAFAAGETCPNPDWPIVLYFNRKPSSAVVRKISRLVRSLDPTASLRRCGGSSLVLLALPSAYDGFLRVNSGRRSAIVDCVPPERPKKAVFSAPGLQTKR